MLQNGLIHWPQVVWGVLLPPGLIHSTSTRAHTGVPSHPAQQHRHSRGVLAIRQPRHITTAAVRMFQAQQRKGMGSTALQWAVRAESSHNEHRTLTQRKEAAWQEQEPASWPLNSTSRYKFYPAHPNHICHYLNQSGVPKKNCGGLTPASN